MVTSGLSPLGREDWAARGVIGQQEEASERTSWALNAVPSVRIEASSIPLPVLSLPAQMSAIVGEDDERLSGWGLG